MHEFDAQVGMLLVNPANVECRIAWPSTRENAVVALKHEGLLDLAAQEFDAASVELRPPPFGTTDPKALHIAELLKMELTQGETASEIYVDSLVTLFGIHLLRDYSSLGKSQGRAKGGLSASGARRIREFLEENFTRKLAVAELAAILGFSPGRFILAFTRTFGQTPHQYVVNLRLDFAERLLIQGNMTIAEIAYLSGFSSQSHLTVTMKKYRHLTPAQMRQGG